MQNRSYLLALGDGIWNFLQAKLFAQFLPPIKLGHASAAVECDFRCEGFWLPLPLCLRAPSLVFSQAAELFLEICARTGLKAPELLPERADLSSF